MCSCQLIVGVPVDSIVARQISPIAPRGGVLMVQLINEELGDGWPPTMDVQFEEGLVATGVLGWIEENPNLGQWTNNPSVIRAITPEDDTALVHPKDVRTGPVLLLELPTNGRGTIRFGGCVIEPQWVDLPLSLPHLNIDPADTTRTLSNDPHPDKPEWNPLEYWRWTLLASRRGVQPPPPPHDSLVSFLAAQQHEQLWRIGFHRLAQSSRSVAATCRDLLTNTGNDGTQSYACWVVQQAQLNLLLAMMLEPALPLKQLATRALEWCEQQQPYIQWLDQVFGSQIILVFANPTLEPTVAAMQWQESDDIPIAVEIPPKETLRTNIQRHPTIDLSIFGPKTSESQLQWLAVQIGNQSLNLPIVAPEVVAKPPSITLQSLYPLWSLESVRSGRPDRVLQQHNTSVQVRKMLGRWELFIQCAGNSHGLPIPENLASTHELRGVEAITILHANSGAMVCIPPEGEPLMVHSPNDLEFFRSIDTRGWDIRIVLPQAWVDDGTLSFAIVRSHGDSTHIETGPLPCVPWKINPSPIVINLSQWDTVRKFPSKRANQ